MKFEEKVWYKFKGEYSAGEWVERTIANREICKALRKLMPNNPKLNDAAFMAGLRFRPVDIANDRVISMSVRKNEHSEMQARFLSLDGMRNAYPANHTLAHLSAFFNKLERPYFDVEFDGRTKAEKAKSVQTNARGLDELLKRAKEIQERLKAIDAERNKLYIEFDKIRDEVQDAKTRTLAEVERVFGE